MRAHHRTALDAFVADVERTDAYDAVILSGSLATGTSTPTSDLDLYLVVADDDYRARRARNDLAVWAPCDYPGGKVVSVDVLRAAAERGTEPMRSSFAGASVVHSTIRDLQGLVDRIAVYPEANRAANQRDFFAALALHAMYFGPQALDRGDPFLLSHSIPHTVLFAGRLLLAHNRILFPCPKQLLAAVAAAPLVPEGFVERSTDLLRAPSTEAFGDYLRLVGAFADWGLPSEQVLTRFMELDEWWWLDHEPALAQR